MLRGVKSLGLFGWIARGDASPHSDVDILVEFDAPSFDHYMDLKFHLEERLGRRVYASAFSVRFAMSRNPRVYLEDVLESIRRINAYVTAIEPGR
jgi:predicted nucleotidyltransferase